jgi:nicotinamidase-related amidase
MRTLRFALTSEQLELLIAFENATGLSHLSEIMARDQSVVSRNLQRIAESWPVLAKVKGRWKLTPLGVQLNQRTRLFLEDQAALFSGVDSTKGKTSPTVPEDCVLIVINAQNALFDASGIGRNNSEAEQNISLILDRWRSRNRRVVHVKHVSDRPGSMFFRNSTGCDFLDIAQPIKGELVIEKLKSSAFAGTNLEALLNEESKSNIVLVGFTANECIDATAKDASASGFNVLVVGDGTASFDLRDPAGKLVKADRIHQLTLANINAFYAKVVSTRDVLA